MGNQTSQRYELARAAAAACAALVDALHTLNDLAERRPYLGNFADADFTGSADLPYLDAATIGVLFDFVVPSMFAAYVDAGANGNRNRQILNQVAKTI